MTPRASRRSEGRPPRRPVPPTPSRLARLAERLERSRRVFLLGLVAAMAVEVVVDWSATLYEISVARTQLREKAVDFAEILRLAVADPLGGAGSDDAPRRMARLERLARRVDEDDTVTDVLLFDASGRRLVETTHDLAPYPRQVARDVEGLLHDADGLRARIAASRHRELDQAIVDGEQALLVRFAPASSTPTATAPRGEGAVIYQDRLYDEARAERPLDRSHVWAVAPVTVEDAGRERTVGAVLVALTTEGLRATIRKKLAKGVAITLFFLGLILYQQLGARREKLRALSLKDSLAAARRALAAALPTTPPTVNGLAGALAFEQAERLGGTVFDFALRTVDERAVVDVCVALPEGSGVDVAVAAVFLRDELRVLREADPSAPPKTLLTRFAARLGEAPIHRRVALAIYRVDVAAGRASGVLAGAPPPLHVDADGEPLEVALEPLEPAHDAHAGGSDLLEGPLLAFDAPLPPGATHLFYSDGLPLDGPHPLDAPRRRAIARAHAARPLEELPEALRAATLESGAPVDDVLALALRRDA